jgi:hypothetical protein
VRVVGKPGVIQLDEKSACRTLGPRRIRVPPIVAVGTTITERPPHRSVRARLRIRLLLRMSVVEAVIGMGMQDAG